MDNKQKPFVDGRTYADQAILILRMEFIMKGENEWVIENRLTFLKTDLVLCQINAGFVVIPLKDIVHAQIIPCHATTNLTNYLNYPTLYPNNFPNPFPPVFCIIFIAGLKPLAQYMEALRADERVGFQPTSTN